MHVRVANGFLLAALAPIAACSASDRAAGTYSTLSFNEQSGDLHGLEVSIVPVDGGLVASVQIAEEGINELHLAEITEVSGMMLFSTQLHDGEIVKFKMKCTLKFCVGEYTWGHADVKFRLPKSPGYWNRTN
jgi:hypothetical protein